MCVDRRALQKVGIAEGRHIKELTTRKVSALTKERHLPRHRLPPQLPAAATSTATTYAANPDEAKEKKKSRKEREAKDDKVCASHGDDNADDDDTRTTPWNKTLNVSTQFLFPSRSLSLSLSLSTEGENYLTEIMVLTATGEESNSAASVRANLPFCVRIVEFAISFFASSSAPGLCCNER